MHLPCQFLLQRIKHRQIKHLLSIFRRISKFRRRINLHTK